MKANAPSTLLVRPAHEEDYESIHGFLGEESLLSSTGFMARASLVRHGIAPGKASSRKKRLKQSDQLRFRFGDVPLVLQHSHGNIFGLEAAAFDFLFDEFLDQVRQFLGFHEMKLTPKAGPQEGA